MARRPESEAVLTREQLAEFTRRLQMLSEKVYVTTYRDCRYDRKKLPPAAAIQQLVACWRVLRKSERPKWRHACDMDAL
jgi:hypothetical protein